MIKLIQNQKVKNAKHAEVTITFFQRSYQFSILPPVLTFKRNKSLGNKCGENINRFKVYGCSKITIYRDICMP